MAHNDFYHKRPIVDDKLALEIEALWKAAIPSATLLPVIGLPSNADGVLTLTHRHGDDLLKINGLPSKSPLSNNALYSAEVSKGKYINLYEVLLPDIPGEHGEPSTAEIYAHLLSKAGLSVAGVHFHWWGNYIFNQNGERIDRGVAAIHHQGIGIHPIEFSIKTIKALKKVFKIIERRVSERNNTH